MKLLLDLGNTRLKWCTLDDDTLGPTHAFALDRIDREDERERLSASLDAVSHSRDIWLASVAAPAIRQRVLAALQSRLPPIQPVGPPHDSAALALAYPEPATFGVDRWLCLLAGADAASLVVSCGTALTLDLVDAGRRHLGGLIAASPSLAQDALLARATHLPAGSGRPCEFADNTRDAIASGTMLAAAGLIERQYAVASERLGSAPRVLLTGGGAEALAPALRVPHELRPQLLFEGLRELLRQTP